MMTGEQYIESIAAKHMKIYLLGRKLSSPVGDPILSPSLRSVKMTYDLAQDEKYSDVMTATSHLNGEKINRFTHIHQNVDDLICKVKMQRLLGQKTGSCFQRCVGMDAINSVYTITFGIDRKYNTQYHSNFLKFLEYCQKNDLFIDGAMTDAKGTENFRLIPNPTLICFFV